MNICIVSTYSCTFDEFQQVVNASMDEASKFLTDWELVKVNDHKSIMLCNVHDMEGYGSIYVYARNARVG
jgi:hypothetical protein